MKTINVNLGDKSYPIMFGDGICQNIAKIIKPIVKYDRVVLVCDMNTYPLYGERIIRSLEISFDSVCVIPTGESIKTIETVSEIYRKFYECHLTRESLVITLGGGVVSDLGGYAAATYMRGFNVIHIPTTIIGMTDAAIGGKTGYDLPHGKNLIGAFHQPKAVICDFSLMRSLPKAYFQDGMAEIIKYALNRDAVMFETLNSDEIPMRDIICRCAEIKAEIVSEDEKEGGKRKILNFGHTVGHAIETCTKYTDITHGNAVAAGMIAEIRIGEKLGITPSDTAEAVLKLFDKMGISVKADYLPEELISVVGADKKRHGDQIDMILLEKIGRAAVYPLSLKKISELLK